MKKNKVVLPNGNKLTSMQKMQLALAFVGEHKELFEEWIKSKGGKLVKDDE